MGDLKEVISFSFDTEREYAPPSVQEMYCDNERGHLYLQKRGNQRVPFDTRNAAYECRGGGESQTCVARCESRTETGWS